jgi:large subunit ribosomal protein L21
MFAVVKSGGKQYRVSEGTVILTERVAGEDMVEMRDVLMIATGDSVAVGDPVVAGAIVRAKILKHCRSKKVIVFKKTRRHNYRRKAGHRQLQTLLQVTEIVAANLGE